MAARKPPVRSRAWAVLATLAVHLGVAAFIASRPPPPPQRVPPPELHVVEIWDGELARVSIPSPSSSASEPASEPAAAAARDDASPIVIARAGHRSRTRTTTPAPPQSGSIGASTHGASPLALSGLRASHRSASTVQAPMIDPPTHGRAVFDTSGDAALERPARDGKPRSLAEAGFRPPRRDGKRILQHDKFRAVLHPDGRLSFVDVPKSLTDPTSVLKGAGMPGLAEAAVAATGQELYVKEKRALLQDTFELRLSMAVAFAEKQIDRRLRALYRELVAIWYDTDRSAIARRKALFQRWDECDEDLELVLPSFVRSVPASLDEKRRAAGEKAREEIEAFIRTHLPAGSADAYSLTELQRLDAQRKSRAHFDPYGGGDASTRGSSERATTEP